MKKSFIYLAMLTFLFAACKKDESSTPAPVAVTKYLQSSIDANGDSTAIEYNLDKYIYREVTFPKGENGYYVEMPDYLGGKQLLNVVVSSKTDFSDHYTHQTITYNDVSKPITINFFNTDGTLSQVDSIVYNNDGKISVVYNYEYNAIKQKNEYRKRYTYLWDAKGKNIYRMEIEYYNIADAMTVAIYTYDDKVNPAPKVTDYYIVKFDEDQLPGLLSSNNILTANTGNDVDHSTTIQNNTYTYDEDGYPVAMTLRSTTQYTGQAAQSDSVVIRAHYGK